MLTGLGFIARNRQTLVFFFYRDLPEVLFIHACHLYVCVSVCVCVHTGLLINKGKSENYTKTRPNSSQTPDC